ncbi:MAG: OsmC family protein [Planctomycetota bacterium]
MHESNVSYTASFKFKATSDNYSVNIQYPKPNSPDGIEPVPMFLGSLGGCFAVYLERYLASKKLAFKGFDIKVKSEMAKEPPICLKVIDVEIKISGLNMDKNDKEALLRFVNNCPLHTTLHNNPTVNVNLI